MNTFLNDPAWHKDDAQFQIYGKRSKGLGYLFGQNIHGQPAKGLGKVFSLKEGYSDFGEGIIAMLFFI